MSKILLKCRGLIPQRIWWQAYFLYYAEFPCLNEKLLQPKLTLVDDLWVLLREGLESLPLLCSFFNIHLWFNLDGLGNLLIVGLQFLLTRNPILFILTPRHEICGAKDNKFCQFIMKIHGVEVDVVLSRGNWWSVDMFYCFFRGLCLSGNAGPLLSAKVFWRIPVRHPCLSLDILQPNQGIAEAVMA